MTGDHLVDRFFGDGDVRYGGPPPTRRPAFDAGTQPAGLIPPPSVVFGGPERWGPGSPAAGTHPAGYAATAPARPGQVVAAGVVAMVAGGLLVASSVLLLLGAAFASSFQDTFEPESSVPLELTVAGFADLAASGLLVLGGLLVLTRRGAGPSVLCAGAVLVLAEAGYWLARYADVATGTVLFFGVLFAGLSVAAAALAWTRPVRAWLHSPAEPLNRTAS